MRERERGERERAHHHHHHTADKTRDFSYIKRCRICVPVLHVPQILIILSMSCKFLKTGVSFSTVPAFECSSSKMKNCEMLCGCVWIVDRISDRCFVSVCLVCSGLQTVVEMSSTHLSGGKVNIARVQDYARKHLFALLDKIEGTKVLS